MWQKSSRRALINLAPPPSRDTLTPPSVDMTAKKSKRSQDRSTTPLLTNIQIFWKCSSPVARASSTGFRCLEPIKLSSRKGEVERRGKKWRKRKEEKKSFVRKQRGSALSRCGQKGRETLGCFSLSTLRETMAKRAKLVSLSLCRSMWYCTVLF